MNTKTWEVQSGNLKWSGAATDMKDALTQALDKAETIGHLVRFRSSGTGERRWKYIAAETALEHAGHSIEKA